MKDKLSGKTCPICNYAILPYSTIANMDRVTEPEQTAYEKFDASQDPFCIECTNCGYIMAFNNQKFFR